MNYRLKETPVRIMKRLYEEYSFTLLFKFIFNDALTFTAISIF